MLLYYHCTKAAMASSASAILYGMVEVRLLEVLPEWESAIQGYQTILYGADQCHARASRDER